MNRSFLEVEPRDFKPMAVPGLEKEVRDAVNAALKALSTWRNEIADTNRHNGKRVIEKMAAAAAALGWPEQIVDAARVQMQSIAEMQIQKMDHMMDVPLLSELHPKLQGVHGRLLENLCARPVASGAKPGKDFSLDTIADGEAAVGFGNLSCSSQAKNPGQTR